MKVRISLAVTTESTDVLTRVAEQFARTAIGLGLDGVETFLMCGPADEEDVT